MTKEVIQFKYNFVFSQDKKLEFILNFDNKTFELLTTDEPPYPHWTELNYHRCPNCTLTEEQSKYCPTAVNLSQLIKTFSTFVSYETVKLIVETPQRTYIKDTTLQKALGSLIGIYMATSNCPILSKLRPLVRFHLPVATSEETLFRVISIYLINQYILYKKGKEPDWELNKLKNLYEDIKIVNKTFCTRISTIVEKDAPLNAVIVLNCFAEWIHLLSTKPDLNLLEHLLM
ncbi:MAG: hypothetical protein RMJ13_06425 [Elusimicrobiota bacterium]|nr:hypothetical protein [Elusimicrobiota bacterium]